MFCDASTQFFPVVIFYAIMVQYQNKKIDVGTFVNSEHFYSKYRLV